MHIYITFIHTYSYIHVCCTCMDYDLEFTGFLAGAKYENFFVLLNESKQTEEYGTTNKRNSRIEMTTCSGEAEMKDFFPFFTSIT